MANGLKGELPIDALGVRWTFLLDFNALCTMESELGIEMGQEVTGMGLGTIRSVFRIALSTNHDDVDDIKAGQIINDIGIHRAAELLAEGMKLAFPEAVGNAKKPPAAAKSGSGAAKPR